MKDPARLLDNPGSDLDVLLLESGLDEEPPARIADRTLVLQEKMDENVERLRAAIDATRRRVDAVMRAIRDQVAPSGSYQADGRMQTLAKSPSIQAGGRLV